MLKCTIRNSNLHVDCDGQSQDCKRLCSNGEGDLYRYNTLSDKRKLNTIKNHLSQSFGTSCFICGDPVTYIRDVKHQIEHVYPKDEKFLKKDEDKFLESCLKNFKLVCGKCNLNKGNEHISKLTYEKIYAYQQSRDDSTYIDKSGLNFEKENFPISLYYNLADDYNYALEFDVLVSLNSTGKIKYMENESNKYILNSLNKEQNEI